MRTLIWLVLVAGCTVDARDYTGPTIEMQLTNNGADTVQDTEPMPSFQLGTDPQYSIAVEILTHSGEETTKSTSKSSQVASVATSFTVGGMTVPAPSFQREDVPLDPSFTSTAPIVLPASAMGGTLAVHATARDGNDLESNVIDFSIALQ